MQGLPFRLTAGDFVRLDTFLSSVTATVGKSYEFTTKPFTNCARGDVLRALGFEFMHLKYDIHPVYCFKGIPADPPAQIVVEKSVDATSGQWAVLTTVDNLVYLRWNGPKKGIEDSIIPPAFITAKEAREMTLATKDLQVILENVRLAADSGNYELTLTEQPGDRVCQRLAELGFKMSDTDFFRISW